MTHYLVLKRLIKKGMNEKTCRRVAIKPNFGNL